METNIATDPYVTNEMECLTICAGKKAERERTQPAPARAADKAADPFVTNPLPDSTACQGEV